MAVSEEYIERAHSLWSTVRSEALLRMRDTPYYRAVELQKLELNPVSNKMDTYIFTYVLVRDEDAVYCEGVLIERGV